MLVLLTKCLFSSEHTTSSSVSKKPRLDQIPAANLDADDPLTDVCGGAFGFGLVWFNLVWFFCFVFVCFCLLNAGNGPLPLGLFLEIFFLIFWLCEVIYICFYLQIYCWPHTLNLVIVFKTKYSVKDFYYRSSLGGCMKAVCEKGCAHLWLNWVVLKVKLLAVTHRTLRDWVPEEQHLWPFYPVDMMPFSDT